MRHKGFSFCSDHSDQKPTRQEPTSSVRIRQISIVNRREKEGLVIRNVRDEGLGCKRRKIFTGVRVTRRYRRVRNLYFYLRWNVQCSKVNGDFLRQILFYSYTKKKIGPLLSCIKCFILQTITTSVLYERGRVCGTKRGNVGLFSTNP